MDSDPFSAFLSALANGGGASSNGQPKPLDISAVFSSLFNTGENTPKLDSPLDPQTDAAGMSQGFQGITQGFEGLNTMPRPEETAPDDFWSMLSLFT